MAKTTVQVFKFSPSDFVFLREECHRCFYKKVVWDQPRPRTPFPKLFNRLDQLEKNFYCGMDTCQVSDSLPPGIFQYSEHWVESKKFRVPGHDTPFFIRGKFDVAAAFDDGTFGVIDFKTTSPADKNIRLYSRQLHAYALALEHPAPGKLGLAPVSLIGILAVDPVEMVSIPGGSGFRLETSYINFPRDNEAFKQFLVETIDLLEAPNPPPPNPDCAFCQSQAPGKERT